MPLEQKLDTFWLRLTAACNNSCVFCLDYENQVDGQEKIVSFEKIVAAIGAIKQPQTRKIVLSGGEPTLHPRLPEIISLAKKHGFKKIQLITNGRMFYYKKFCQQIVAAGLDEITISFHSHLSAVYEKLTGIAGSYQQAWQGLQNILAVRRNLDRELIVNIDIVVSKINIDTLKETILFFARQGIYEFDLLFIIPFGRAILKQDDLFFDYSLQLDKIREVLDLNKDPKFHLWLNRFPPEFLVGYEQMIQAPEKLFDEIRGRQSIFKAAYKKNNQPMNCYDKKRCPRCYIKKFCDSFQTLRTGQGKLNEIQTTISLEKFLDQPDIYIKKFAQEKLVLQLPVWQKNACKLMDLANYKLPSQWILKNIPRCLIGSNKNEVVFSVLPKATQSLNLEKLVKFYIDNMYFLKPLTCQTCIYDSTCQGLNINYVRDLGFCLLQSIKE